MIRHLSVALLLCALVPGVRAQHHSSGSGGHSSKSSTHSSKSKSHSSKSRKSTGTSNNKTVHVDGYYRKDGTYVHEYDRAAPGEGNGRDTPSTMPGRPAQPYRKDYMAKGYTPHASVTRDKHGKIKRSRAATEAFQRENPCPSTGRKTGGCPGYVKDHKIPLECGGADDPGNMQWQTVAEAKEKDKTESACRQ
jgi:hypothetical protein